jgi:hypothetical protein
MTLRAPALLILLGCQEPFDTDRHDLRGLRIAAVGVHDGVAEAAIWSGLGPWHEAAPTLAWTLDSEPLGEGFDVTVSSAGVLGLTVTGQDGEVRTAEVTVSSVLPSLSVSRAAVSIGDDISIDARRALDAEAVEDTVPSGESVRMTLAGLQENASARWMSASGTVLELEVDAADLIPEEILLDDGEISARTALGDGRYPGLALAIDGSGGNDWLWVDAAVGVTEPLLRHRGLLLLSDDVPGAGLVAATLAADDVGGVRLEAVAAVKDASEQELLSCMPEGAETFELSWIVQGRCPRPDVLGARVVVEAW